MGVTFERLAHRVGSGKEEGVSKSLSGVSCRGQVLVVSRCQCGSLLLVRCHSGEPRVLWGSDRRTKFVTNEVDHLMSLRRLKRAAPIREIEDLSAIARMAGM